MRKRDKDRGVDNGLVVAAALAHPLLGRELSRDEKKTGGSVVHSAFGATMGAMYGELCETFRLSVSDSAQPTELLFGRAPTSDGSGAEARSAAAESFCRKHLSGLGAHVIFGLTTEAVRQVLRHAR